MPVGYAVKLLGGPAGKPRNLKAVQLHKRTHYPLGKIEQMRVEYVLFEQVGQPGMGHDVGNGRARPFGLGGKTLCKFGIDGCADGAQPLVWHKAAKNCVSVALILGEVCLYCTIHGAAT